MYKKIKLALVISSVALLSACGGGGGSAPAASALATDNNPLKKYQGTYYICDDDDHSKKILSITATGTNSMSMTYVENIYQNASCTGAIVGTYSMPLPVTATYQSQTTANFPAVTILPLSDIVDQLTISSPAMTAQLTGSGVAGSCVYYTSGNTCKSNLVTPATTITGASYLRGDYFVTLSLSNGVLVADGILSKNSSFKFSELISTTPSVSSSSSSAGGGGDSGGTASGFSLSDFSGKSNYYVSAAAYSLGTFNADGSTLSSNMITSGSPVLNPTSAAWSISNSELLITYQGFTQRYTLISTDTVNRYYKVKKTSDNGIISTVGFFYDQTTGLAQAQNFVATHQVP